MINGGSGVVAGFPQPNLTSEEYLYKNNKWQFLGDRYPKWRDRMPFSRSQAKTPKKPGKQFGSDGAVPEVTSLPTIRMEASVYGSRVEKHYCHHAGALKLTKLLCRGHSAGIG